MRQAIADAICEALREHGYTCYACAICGNHIHLLIRTHKRDALTMWNNFAESIRTRVGLRFPQKISPHHPVISSRPYKVFLYAPEEVWGRIDYVAQNPLKEKLPAQHGDLSRRTTTSRFINNRGRKQTHGNDWRRRRKSDDRTRRRTRPFRRPIKIARFSSSKWEKGVRWSKSWAQHIQYLL
jgi:REP element-mobilizing transposase RayT